VASVTVAACGSGASTTSGFGNGEGGASVDGGLQRDGGPLRSRDGGGKKDVSSVVLTGPDSGGGDGSCATQVTCASAGAGCGAINNGCGGITQCGGCPGGQTCGGGGKPSQCGSPCVPKTCAELGFDCGPAGDGCGGQLSCGSCGDAGTCGGGGAPSKCGVASSCVPKTCAELAVNCGTQGDGCGNSLSCGTCTAPDTCGGGGMPSVCGTPPCTPKTCAQIGTMANPACGPAADGCGGLLQCGSCSEPQTCGGISAGLCGVPSTCTNLCLKQVTCSNPAVTTTLTGTVYAPNGVDPLPNVLVYIPNSAVAPFTPGVACETCADGVTGSPLVSAATDTHGNFSLQNVPVGTNIPLVIQTGRWRRQTVIPQIVACVANALPACTAATAASGACLTSLPQTKAQGDIPHMAFATGSIDALECVIRKIGVADSEFTNPSGTGRINFYVGIESSTFENGPNGPGNYITALGGAQINASTPTEDQLVGSLPTLKNYDMVLFPCEAAEITSAQTIYKQANPATSSTALGTWSTFQAGYQSNVIAYANAGGRIFATHYSYIWLYNDSPFSGTANWDVNQVDNFTGTGFPPDQTGYINVTFPKGLELAEWLQNVGASSTQGQIPLNTLRWDLSWGATEGVVAPSQLWMNIADSQIGDVAMHYTFNTPVGQPAASQCGKVLFDDFHVESVTTTDTLGDVGLDDGIVFPGECPAGPMTAQEKLLEFMIFDLGSCVSPSTPSCTPTTCAALGYDCGPAGDGCGNLIQCGTCPAGQSCGGGGMPSVCGAPTCAAKSCSAQGIQCGPAGDGCGNALQCGTCPAGQSCGGGGVPGVCGAGTCQPETCASQSIQCGPAGDGCGNSLSCGTCPPGQTCGGGGKSGVCGSTCTPQTCAGLGYNCGAAADGCGGELSCGTCAAPNTCGGGGQANVCGGSIPK